MKYLSVLIKPASSLCNLRCSYCFYIDETKNRNIKSYGILPLDKAKAMIEKCFKALDEDGTMVFIFQGGEPLIAGVAWFKSFCDIVNETKKEKQKVSYGLQTNATLINEEWASFFHDHEFLIGISLDGYQSNMDKYRYDPLKKSIYYKVMNGIDVLIKYKVEYNILTVVTKSLAKNPEGLFKFYVSHGFQYVQLIPCLPSLNKDSDMDKESLTPELYASFYKAFFDLWYDYTLKGNMLDVNLFSNLLEMLCGRMPYQCGMLGRCVSQYVVEGDGCVYPCDFYVLDKYKMGNFLNDEIASLHQSSGNALFLNEFKAEKEYCKSCHYVRMCHGGCKRQNVCYLSDDYCGYKDVLDHCIDKLAYLVHNYR